VDVEDGEMMRNAVVLWFLYSWLSGLALTIVIPTRSIRFPCSSNRAHLDSLGLDVGLDLSVLLFLQFTWTCDALFFYWEL
jgi:hypothetical protein